MATLQQCYFFAELSWSHGSQQRIYWLVDCHSNLRVIMGHNQSCTAAIQQSLLRCGDVATSCAISGSFLIRLDPILLNLVQVINQHILDLFNISFSTIDKAIAYDIQSSISKSLEKEPGVPILGITPFVYISGRYRRPINNRFL